MNSEISDQGIVLGVHLPDLLEQPMRPGTREQLSRWVEAALEALNLNPKKVMNAPEAEPVEKVQDLINLIWRTAIPHEHDY